MSFGLERDVSCRSPGTAGNLTANEVLKAPSAPSHTAATAAAIAMQFGLSQGGVGILASHYIEHPEPFW